MKNSKKARAILLTSATLTVSGLVPLSLGVSSSTTEAAVGLPQPTDNVLNWIKEGEEQYSPFVKDWGESYFNYDNNGVNWNNPEVLYIKQIDNKPLFGSDIANNEEWEFEATFNNSAPFNGVRYFPSWMKDFTFGLNLSSDFQFVPNSFYIESYASEEDKTPIMSKQITELGDSNPAAWDNFAYPLHDTNNKTYTFSKNGGYIYNITTTNIPEKITDEKAQKADPFGYMMTQVFRFNDAYRSPIYNFMDNFTALGHAVAFWTLYTPDNNVPTPIIKLKFKIRKSALSPLKNEQGNLRPSQDYPIEFVPRDYNNLQISYRSFISAFWVDRHDGSENPYYRRIKSIFLDRSKFQNAYFKADAKVSEVNNEPLSSEAVTPNFRTDFYYNDLNNPLGTMQFTEKSFAGKGVSKTAIFSYDGSKVPAYPANSDKVKSAVTYYDEKSLENYFVEESFEYNKETFTYTDNKIFWFNNKWYEAKKELIKQIKNAVNQGWSGNRIQAALKKIIDAGEFKLKSKDETKEQLLALPNIADVLKQIKYSQLIFQNVITPYQTTWQQKDNHTYSKASPSIKNPLDTLIEKFKSYYIYSPNGLTGGTVNDTAKLDGAQMEADYNQAMKLISELDGELVWEKNVAKAKLNTAEYIIRPPQSDWFIKRIDKCTTVAEVKAIYNEIDPFNYAMRSLKLALKAADRVKPTIKYTNASANVKKAFDDAYEPAYKTFHYSNSQLPTTDINLINKLTNDLTIATNNLDGQAIFDSEITKAKEEINKLNYLNNAQKQSALDKLKNPTSSSVVQTAVTDATTLNTSMQALSEKVTELEGKKTNPKYINATNQEDFNTELNKAKELLNKETGSNENNSAVTTQTTTLQNKWDALNGDAKLQEAKNTALDKFTANNYQYLTQAQADDYKTKINAATTISAVTQLDSSASSLNDAMKKVRDIQTDATSTKKTTNYLDASQENQTAFNNAVTNAENNTVATAKPTLEQAEALVKQYNSAKEELNGNANLANAKTTAKQYINGLTNLNPAQAKSLKDEIDNQTSVAGITPIKTTAKTLDTSMQSLADEVKKAKTVQTTSNYINADNQSTLNNAIGDSNTLLGAQGANKNNTEVQAQIKALQDAVTALNGNTRLQAAKNTANSEIDKLSNLTDAQKNALKAEVNKQTTIANVNTAKSNADAVNTAMGDLKTAVSNAETKKATPAYTQATNQQPFNEALTTANTAIKSSGLINPAKINEIKQTLDTASSKLNGDTQLKNAKDAANAAIELLPNLNDAQKNALKAEVNKQTTIADVNKAKTNADTVNAAMKKLTDAITENTAYKTNPNYTEATSETQKPFNTAITNASNEANSGKNLTISDINSLIKTMSDAKEKLNGNAQVQETKTTAESTINGLTHLTPNQKQQLKTLVNNKITKSDIDKVVTQAQNLDSAMEKLSEAKTQAEKEKATPNYTEADKDKQTALTTAINNATTALTDAQAQTIDPTVVEGDTTALTTAISELNGNTKLQDAKDTFTKALQGLTYLNNAQVAKLNQELTSANTIQAVTALQTTATELNAAMQQLSSAVTTDKTVKSTTNYLEATPSLKTTFDGELSKAEAVIAKTGSAMDKTEVVALNKSLNKAYIALNGDTNLVNAKTEAEKAIKALTHLNNAQQTALVNKVKTDTTNTVESVNSIVTSATAVDKEMENLANEVAAVNKTNYQTNAKYIDADPNLKTAFETAYNNVNSLVNKTTGTANLDIAKIKQLGTTLKDAYTALNGDTNLANAKNKAIQQINGLPHLNQAQKNALNNNIDSADTNTMSAVSGIVITAIQLDNSMNELQQLVNSYTNPDLEKTSDYLNAPAISQVLYKQLLTQSQNVLKHNNSDSSVNLNKDAVSSLKEQLENARNSLLGTFILNQAQAKANATLDTLTNLNNAQLQAAKRAVANALVNADVDTAVANATALNTKMGNLNQAITDANGVKKTANYTQATATPKSAFDTVLTNATNQNNKTTGTNIDSAEVQKLIKALNEATTALDGNIEVSNAKKAAEKLITDAKNLTTAQKNALTTELNNATTVAEAQAVGNKVTPLDTAMKALKDAATEANKVKPTVNYTDADANKKTTFDNKLTEAQNALKDNQNTTLADAQRLAQELTSATTTLNGDTNLSNAKQQAETAIKALTHLNDAQKTALINQVKDAKVTTVAQVNTITTTANALDTSMNNLEKALKTIDDSKYSTQTKYVDADAKLKQEFDNQHTAVTNLTNKKTGTANLDSANIDSLTTNLNNAYNALNGDKAFGDAQAEGIKQINETLNNLNQAQKTGLVKAINKATTKEGVSTELAKAVALNTSMGELKNLVDEYNKAKVTESADYLNSDQTKQQAYTNAINSATSLTNVNNAAEDANKDKAAVDKLKDQLQKAKQSLDGQNKLEQAQNTANTTLDTLTNLNNAQLQAAKTAVANAKTNAEVTTAVNTATALNTKMGALNQTIIKANKEKEKPAYTQATATPKKAFDTALTNATNAYDKEKGTNIDADAVQDLIRALNNTASALDGNIEVSKAKTAAQQAITNAKNLTTAQKAALTNELNNATTVADAKAIQDKVKPLDDAMKTLKDAIKDAKAAQKTQNYTAADSDKQTTVNTALTNAEAAVNDNANTSLSSAQSLTKALTDATGALNGDSKLTTKKAEVQKAITDAQYLNKAQKDALTQSVTNATNLTDLNNIDAKISPLNNAMKALREQIESVTNTANTPKYKNSNATKQAEFNQALTNANNEINDKTATNIDVTKANQLTKTLNDAYTALDGDIELDAKKQEVIGKIDKLTHLTHNQKEALKAKINNANVNTIQAVEDIYDDADALDKKMNSLATEIQDAKTKTLPTQAYADATPETKDALDTAITTAETFSKLSDGTSSLNLQDVQAKIDAIATAISDLNGESQLTQAKNNAITNLTKDYPHLNTAQINSLTTQINNATSKAKLETTLTNAKTLDQAMEQLANAVKSIQDNNVLTNANYLNASEPNKTQFKDTYDEADKLTNTTITPNRDLDATQVNTLKEKLTTLQSKLDGNNQLNSAKDQAKLKIDALNNLNDAQKDALKTAVDNATTSNGISDTLTTAENLDKKMQELKNKVDAITKGTNTPKYTEASNKQALEDALKAANDALNKEKGKNLNDQAVQNLINNLDNANNALDGDKQLADAKTKAKQDIDALSNLTPSQKQALKDKVDDSKTNTVAKVGDVVKQAKDLDTAMNNLKEAKKQAEAAKTTPNYRDADNDKQTTLDNQINSATETLKNSNVTDPTQINNQIQNLTNATDNLNGDQKFNDLKDKLEKEIADSKEFENSKVFNDANKDQQQAYKDAIKAAEDLKDSNKLNNQDQTAEQLQNLLDNIDKTKKDITSTINSSEEQIKNLPNLTDKQKDDYIKELHNNPDKASDIVKQAVQVDKDKQDAINEINKLPNLSDSDKQKFVDQIKNDDSTKKEDYDKVVKQAIDLNNQIQDVINGLNDLTKDYSDDKANDLQNKINNLKDKTSESDKLQNILDQIKNNQKVKELLNDLRNSDINNPKLPEIINQLNDATNKPNITNTNPDLNNTVDKINDEANKNKAQFDAIKEMLDAIKENDWNKVNQGNNKLNELGIKNNDKFVNYLGIKKALEILNKDIKDITPADIQAIQSVKEGNADNILKTAYEDKVQQLLKDYDQNGNKENLRWPWWVGLAAIITGISGTIYGLFKKNKKQK
ncbi:hypothetical protein [Mycoplasma hafezii]|uniref:hypothetical protein n=1 Tax=Mycoplasma hafezii TaxID=525886 RepID=UPI003CF150E5